MGDQALASKFSEAGLVPDVVPVPPQQKLNISFYKTVEVGDHFHSLDVRPNPKIEYNGQINNDDYFTIVMIDADYPRRDKPTEAAYVHWLIPNIKADPMRKGKATGEQALVGYMPPTPVANSGEHRLVVLLFQHTKQKISQPSITVRTKFNVNEFMKKHSFVAPVAGTFYYVQD